MSTDTVLRLLPELVLLVAATVMFVAGTFVRSRTIWSLAASLALVVSAWCLAMPLGNSQEVASSLAVDHLAQYGRALSLLLGMLLVLVSQRSAAGDLAPENFGALLLLVAGLMLTAGAGELVLLFLGLELVNVPTYALLYTASRHARDPRAGHEAATKYFFLSLVSSAVLLYGLSFMFGAAGTTELGQIRTQLATAAAGGHLLALLALVLVCAGLGFKIAAVPFHFYAPDVYQGTSNSMAGLLAVVPKAVGILVLIRVVVLALPSVAVAGWQMLLVVSLLTMTVGNVLALWQQDLRRLMAYSSIAHAGYMLIGLTAGLAAVSSDLGESAAAAGLARSLSAVLFYLTVYCLATLGIFAALAFLGRDGVQVSRVDELSGLGRTRPAAAVCLAVCLFSLTGIPPLAGFWGKLTLFYSVLAQALPQLETSMGVWLMVLAVGGALNAAIAAGYYLRVIAAMYFRPATSEPAAQGGAGPWAAMLACALLVAICGCLPAGLAEASRAAGQGAVPQPLAIDAKLESKMISGVGRESGN